MSTDALLPRLGLIALLIASTKTTCDASVKFSPRSLRICRLFGVGMRHSFGTFSPQTKTDAIRCSQLAKAFAVRGGSDGTLDNDNDSSDEMQRLRKKWSDVLATPSISWPVTDTVLGDDSTENTLSDVDGTTKIPTQNAHTKALVIMDGFSPYHGQYIAHAALHNHGAAVIHVFSDFMTRYLYEVEGQTDHLSCRLPNLEKEEDVKAWTSLLPSSLEICGIYCESDSGLEDAERLGVALGLYPKWCH